MTAWGTALPFELNNADGRCGSKASIRFLNQLPFDQLFTWLGSPIFERPLCRFLNRDCDDEQRLLWPSLRHSSGTGPIRVARKCVQSGENSGLHSSVAA